MSRFTNSMLFVAACVAGAAGGECRASAGGEGVSVPPAAAEKVQKERMSYALGVEVARTFLRQGMEVDVDQVVLGMKTVLKGERLRLTDEEILKTLNFMAADLRGRQAKAKLAAALDNKKAGEEFLAANARKEGVKTLPSGLQYREIKPGTGTPGRRETVDCRYRGTLIDGTEVDSTVRAGDVVTLALSDPNIIAGLKEALRIMPAGAAWQLFIPHQLAYSGQGAGRLIGPNATLIYDVEVVGDEATRKAGEGRSDGAGTGPGAEGSAKRGPEAPPADIGEKSS